MKKKQVDIEKKNKKTTFAAKVDIVEDTENIKYYSYDREDYTELALIALENNLESIRYISPLCKDYPMLCEKAVKGLSNNFLYIDESVSNYKELGIKAISENPHLVLGIDWNNRYYVFFWKWAISQCYSILGEIDKKRGRLYPVIAKALDEEPNAIYYVNSDIIVYNNLCRFAYSKDNESVIYMDINKVDKKYAMEIIKRQPDRIKNLDNSKYFYDDAVKLAVSLNSNLITQIESYYLEDNIELASELINIVKNNNSKPLEETSKLYISYIEIIQKQKIILNSNDITDEEKAKQLKVLENELKELEKQYIEKIYSEMETSKTTTDYSYKRKCPIEKINDIKIKSKKNLKRAENLTIYLINVLNYIEKNSSLNKKISLEELREEEEIDIKYIDIYNKISHTIAQMLDNISDEDVLEINSNIPHENLSSKEAYSNFKKIDNAVDNVLSKVFKNGEYEFSMRFGIDTYYDMPSRKNDFFAAAKEKDMYGPIYLCVSEKNTIARKEKSKENRSMFHI